jgi:hypothetical protein
MNDTILSSKDYLEQELIVQRDSADADVLYSDSELFRVL